MSSSYSSLDWVLSHWASFTVRRFNYVYYFVFCVFICWDGRDGVEACFWDLSSFNAWHYWLGDL